MYSADFFKQRRFLLRRAGERLNPVNDRLRMNLCRSCSECGQIFGVLRIMNDTQICHPFLKLWARSFVPLAPGVIFRIVHMVCIAV